jgi:ribosome-associated protein
MSEHYDHEDEIEIEAIGIEVSSQPIELYKVFKIANLVGGGGEAKHIISEGYVAVNGELETRKRRKMYDGDFFEFNQEYYVVVCDAPVEETVVQESEPAAQVSKPDKRQSNKQSKKQKSDHSKPEKNKPTSKPKNSNGRSSIDFF